VAKRGTAGAMAQSSQNAIAVEEEDKGNQTHTVITHRDIGLSSSTGVIRQYV